MQKNPSQKEVVQLLCQYVGEELKEILNPKTSEKEVKPHLIYKCISKRCSIGGSIVFQKASGYQNPYSHLKRCVSNGDESHLIKLFYENRNKKTVSQFFIPSATKSKPSKINALFDWLMLIIEKNLPLQFIEEPLLRHFSKHNHKFSRVMLKSVILRLVELVEKRISQEMKEAGCGSILHDGWSHNSVHYVGLFASFIKKIDSTPRLVLLSVSPLANRTDEDESASDSSSEADIEEQVVEFNAENHVRHFREMFDFYNISINDWVICQTCDNAPVNKKIAKLLQIPHVTCKSHALNLEVNYMTRLNHQLKTALNSVHETMLSCKQKLKNSALLRNLTDLKPIIHNQTRWSGKFYMMQRFLRIRTELIEISNDDRSDIVVNSSNGFRAKCEKFSSWLNHINNVTLFLQKRLLTLEKCRGVLDILIDDVERYGNQRGSPLEGCTLGVKYIACDSDITSDPDFENGVVKIQRNMVHTMTPEEHAACEKLRAEANYNDGGGDDNNEDDYEAVLGMSLEDRLTGRKRKHDEHDEFSYMNADFILGSVAEVERLWSICQFILSDTRSRLEPQLFEALVFLKVNSTLWDIHLVEDAYNTRNDRDDNEENDGDE